MKGRKKNKRKKKGENFKIPVDSFSPGLPFYSVIGCDPKKEQTLTSKIT